MEKDETQENRFTLAVESLDACLEAEDNSNKGDNMQKRSILQEALEELDQDPTTRLYFINILDIGIRIKLGIFETQDSTRLLHYDVFVESVTKSLPAEFKDEFECVCVRPQQILPNMSKLVIN